MRLIIFYNNWHVRALTQARISVNRSLLIYFPLTRQMKYSKIPVTVFVICCFIIDIDSLIIEGRVSKTNESLQFDWSNVGKPSFLSN